MLLLNFPPTLVTQRRTWGCWMPPLRYGAMGILLLLLLQPLLLVCYRLLSQSSQFLISFSSLPQRSAAIQLVVWLTVVPRTALQLRLSLPQPSFPALRGRSWL